MKYLMVYLFLFLMGSSVVFSDDRTPTNQQLPRVVLPMKSAGFWIGQTPGVDKVSLSAQDVTAFNARIQDDLKLTKNIFTLTDRLKTESLLEQIRLPFDQMQDKGLYTMQGVRDDPVFFEAIKQNMHLSAVVIGMVPRYGLIVVRADQRLLATDKPLYEKPGDVNFDQVQNSGLEVAEAVAILHASRDKEWFYVDGEISDGWVRADHVAIGEKGQVLDFARPKKQIVITATYADIFADSDMTEWVANVRMGTRLPLVGRMENKFIVKIPTKDKQGKLTIIDGYVEDSLAHVGFLPVTFRNVVTQAMHWMNTPYGWGDTNGYPDCSRLVASVYATMGIVLPRDSKDQAMVGKLIAEFSDTTPNDQKVAILKETPPGSLLVLKGHIMLYLGLIDGIPYAIHATSGYREKNGDSDVVRPLMRVVVSDLSLGEGSHKGSLLKRLKRIVAIEIPDEN